MVSKHSTTLEKQVMIKGMLEVILRDRSKKT